MKIEQLKNIIKNSIKEEVKQIVSEEVNKAMSKILIEMIKEVKTDKKQVEISNEKPIEEDVSYKINTNNPKINNALSETLRRSKSIKRPSQTNLVETFGEFEKIGNKEDVITPTESDTKLDFLKQIIGESVVPTKESVLDSGTDVPDILKKVFKKDFRQLMKKMDEQKKTGSGGYINPSQIISG